MSDASELVRAAFAAARKSGKPDWDRMTTAVLKNRLLDLSAGSFKEQDHGARSILEFAKSLPELLVVDIEAFPPVVHLKESASPPTAPAAGPKAQIRPDLWRAILDYRSGLKYVWDSATSSALPAESEADNRLALPTITEAQFREWRREFVEQVRSSNQQDTALIEKLEGWAEKNLPTHLLPPPLRGKWNGVLKGHVQQCLDSWFATNQLEKVPAVVAPTQAPEPVEKVQLRRTVQAVIDVMSESELGKLNLPASAIARLFRR
jgi:hypothetical protein